MDSSLPYHIPVLLNEVIEGLNVKENGCYLDLTFGGGGHSKALLTHLGENGKLIVFDQDLDAQANLPEDNRVHFVNQNFRYFKKYLKLFEIDQVDGIMADLGISSHQIDVPDRGFSIRFEGPLDMRMNQEDPISAADIINGYDAKEITRILKEYGEIRKAERLTEIIVKARKNRIIRSTGDLKQLLAPHLRGILVKELAKVFQALRIEVNAELDALKQMLTDSAAALKQSGRLAVLSYHSLEDRLVKNYVKTGDFSGNPEKDLFGNFDKPFNVVNKKVIVPDKLEIKQNKRARSAKLRLAEKI